MHIRILVLYITVMVSGVFFFVYGALRLPPPDSMYTFKKSEAGEGMLEKINNFLKALILPFFLLLFILFETELIKEISTEEAINANTSSLEPTLIFLF